MQKCTADVSLLQKEHFEGENALYRLVTPWPVAKDYHLDRRKKLILIEMNFEHIPNRPDFTL